MKIGILGSGDVAKALARGFLLRGDEVTLGTRDAAKLAEWQLESGGKAHVGSFAQATAFGEIVVVATRGMATPEILAAVGPASFAGKVVIDTTNPLRFDDAGVHLALGFDDSLGEQVQRALPGAKVVKAFNTCGNQFFVQPAFAGGPPTMFVAGDDDGAKRTVAGILNDFGWENADIGGIETSRYLEPMCMVWLAYGASHQSWNHAFKLLT